MRVNDCTVLQTTDLKSKPTKKVSQGTESKHPLRDSKQTHEETVLTPETEKDTVEISPEAKQESNDINDELRKMADRLKDLTEQLEIARKQSQGAAKRWETLIKCLKIAMRIMSGDIVPRADHRYLAKNEPEMYSKAITMRMHKDNPKKHKRLSKDEKKEKPENTSDANRPKDAEPAAPLPENDEVPEETE